MDGAQLMMLGSGFERMRLFGHSERLIGQACLAIRDAVQAETDFGKRNERASAGYTEKRGATSIPADRPGAQEVRKRMKLLFERLRSRRLASTFVLLATLSAAIVAGFFAAHGVRGQEKQNDSGDATPLKVVNSTIPPNDFVRIAKAVGPAVVNINTQTLPKETGNQQPHNFHFRQQPNQQSPDDNGDNDQQNGPDIQTFFDRFFGGQAPGGRMKAITARCRSRWARASSSMPRDTSSPTSCDRQGGQDLREALDRPRLAGFGTPGAASSAWTKPRTWR